jgi:hypothetical protein
MRLAAANTIEGVTILAAPCCQEETARGGELFPV